MHQLIFTQKFQIAMDRLMHVDKIGTRALGFFVFLKTCNFPTQIFLYFMRKRILRTWQRIKILFFKNKMFLKI